MSKVVASTYELIEKIGSGGGGNVYLAYHQRLGKKVVLKADKRKIILGPELLRREVDILKELKHPYIPQVYDFFIEDETVYTVMDYIEGESLDRPLKRGEKFPQAQVIQWARQVLEALQYLHSPIHGNPPHGYVHSDIKPANIMRTPQNDICLIDFNIALALGEDHAIGCSAGYASPEHYGLDYSSFGNDSTLMKDEKTDTLFDETATMSLSDRRSSSSAKKVVPDVRSDIYSLGATLYHLLSGERPSINALDVVPLSEKEFSPQIVQIISKAMNPNPDFRYQTADEMLDVLNHLHQNDDRTKRLRRNRIIAYSSFLVLFVVGLMAMFVGLKRMQVVESWLKLAEYSQTALKKGDINQAIEYSLQALPKGKNIFTPPSLPQAQKALTDALGVYDLADGFKEHQVVVLPGNPLYMAIAPQGKTAACVYSGFVAIINTETAEIMVTLPASKSALTEVEYLDNDTIIYAGSDGIKCYHIPSAELLWTGEPGTAISVSQDKKTVAAVNKDETFATVYDAATGKVKSKIDFHGKHQSTAVNDRFANPDDNLFEINADGTMLGVSFADGSLEIYDLTDSGNDIELFDSTSGYTHFEGGFYEQYFAFSATNASDSVFAVIDTESKTQTGGFESEGYFGVNTDENGIYVQIDNLLVKIHPVTGEQTPLITTSEHISHFATDNGYTIATSKEQVIFFDADSKLISDFEKQSADFVQIANGIALTGSMDTPEIKILKYESHSQNEVFVYDSSYEHDEARISADEKTVMLFSYMQFRVYDIDGTLINEVDIPNADQVYDQQFIREGTDSYLEVTYNDGLLLTYSAADGKLISEKQIEKPDLSLYEQFYTDSYRISSPLHGSPTVYNKNTGEKVCELTEDGYLTYVTQVGEYILTQYITVDDDYFYGVLLNEKCEVLAYLPYLCDVKEGELYFDYPSGNMRKSRIFKIEELIKMAQTEQKGGK